MKRTSVTRGMVVAAALLAGASLVGPAAAADGGSDKPDTPACVAWHTQVRYANYGYDHWVVIHNGCQREAACAVTTDVNPQAIHVGVPVNKTREVLTYRGSPAREFRARVRCRLHG